MQLFYSFLQDSLDLGHDDLQRTLQQQSNAARSSNGHVPSPHAVDLNPMEFIEQNHGAGGGSGGSTGNPNAGPTGTFYYYLPFGPYQTCFCLPSRMSHFGELPDVVSQKLLKKFKKKQKITNI